MFIAIMFGAGPIGKALAAYETYGWPFIQIIYGAVGSKSGATAMISVILALLIAASVGYLASASRQLWAFSRDRGMPFSSLLSSVRKFEFALPSASSTLTLYR